MKKIKALACIPLALILLCSFAGCGAETATSSARPSESLAENEISVPEAVEKAPDSAVSEAESELEATGVQLPAPEHMTFTYTITFPGFLSEIDPTTLQIWDVLENISNMRPEITALAQESAAERYGIMFSAGEYADVMSSLDEYYAGGLEAAYEAEIITDIRPLLETDAPDFYELWSTKENVMEDTLNAAGQLLAMSGIRDEEFIIDRGFFINQDMLDDLGAQSPKTLDDLTELLRSARDTYGCTAAFGITYGGLPSLVASAYGVEGYYNEDWYLDEDGELQFAIASDGAKQTLTYLNMLYEEGLITPDYATYSSWDLDPLINSDQCIVISGMLGSLQNYESNWVATPTLRLTEDQVLDSGFIPSYVYENYRVSFSAACENLDYVLAYFNYMFTEEGATFANWGIQDETYVVEPDGSYQFTEFMTENEEYFLDVMQTIYTNPSMPYYYCTAAKTYTYTDAQREAGQIWNSAYDSYDRTVAKFTLDSEVANQIATTYTDISVWIDEHVTKFVIGDENIETEWDGFVSGLYQLGLADVEDVYRAAYHERAGV